MYSEVKKISVFAGLKQSRIKKVGYKLVKFTYSDKTKDQLVSEKTIKIITK